MSDQTSMTSDAAPGAAAGPDDPGYDAALRSVVAAAYLRAGQSETPAQLDALVTADRQFVTFDPRAATESDIVGLVGSLGLTDASLPPPPAPVSYTRTLSSAPLPDYAGAPDLTDLSVTDLAGMLQRGETTSREIVLQYLYKIQKLDHAGPALRSVTQLNPDLLTLADQADAERAQAEAQGKALPPLFGIPILVKNNIDTGDDLRTTASSLALIGSKPAGDADLIEQLRDQGALIMGKANMSEWANLRWGDVRVSPDGGVVLNPQDPSLSASGSSSGSAAAAAMQFAPLTLGTETNGSLMAPAVTEHVWALKPTTGLVSRTGVIPGWETVDSPGPMADSVRDLAIAMDAMKGLDPTDPESGTYTGDRSQSFTSQLNGDLTGVRIGVNASLPGAQALVQSLATSSHATVTTFTRADEGAATKQALLSLSDDDLGVVYGLTSKTPLPTDPVQRASVIGTYRTAIQNATSGFSVLNNFAFVQNLRGLYQIRKYIDSYLATRVSNPQDYTSAFVRLMGDLYTPNSTDPTQFAKSLNDVVTSDNLNNPVQFETFPVLYGASDNIASAAAKTPQQFAQAAGFASTADYDAAIENWKRITSLILTKTRQNLGIDVAATSPTNTNFTFNTSAFATTPNLSVPIGPGTGTSQMILSADTSQDGLLLRVGYALDQALQTPQFASLRSPLPSPPETGFANQPVDTGPLLPLVLNDLDDHDRASQAHLLSTQMAPLVLDSTTAASDTTFDGRISGDGGLIKEGDGTQALTGASDFTGDVQVWDGTLALDRAEALGDPANTVTLEKGAGLLALSGLTLGRSLTLRDGGTLGVAAGQVLVQDGTVSGNGGLTKTGAGQLTLTADNAYTGGTDIAAGTLAVSRDSELGQPYGAVTIADATLSVGASFVTTRAMTLQGAAGLAVAAGAVLTTSNVLSGTGTLTKLGPGTLALTNADTYSGGTELDGGALELGALGAAGAGAIGFGGSAQLILDAAAFGSDGALANVLDGLGAGDTVDFKGVAFDPGDSATLSGDTVALAFGPADYSLTLGGPLQGSLALASDGAGGTLLSVAPPPAPAPAPAPGSTTPVSTTPVSTAPPSGTPAPGAGAPPAPVVTSPGPTNNTPAPPPAAAAAGATTTTTRDPDGTVTTTVLQPDGSRTVTVAGGPYFDPRPYGSYTDSYGPDGTALSETRTRKDGHHATAARAPGQSLVSLGDDTMSGNGQASTAFVFTPGFGQDTVLGFDAFGVDHGVLTLAASSFSSLADVLHHTRNTAAGAVITDPATGDAITVVGVTKAQLLHNPADIAFHP